MRSITCDTCGGVYDLENRSADCCTEPAISNAVLLSPYIKKLVAFQSLLQIGRFKQKDLEELSTLLRCHRDFLEIAVSSNLEMLGLHAYEAALSRLLFMLSDVTGVELESTHMLVKRLAGCEQGELEVLVAKSEIEIERVAYRMPLTTEASVRSTELENRIADLLCELGNDAREVAKRLNISQIAVLKSDAGKKLILEHRPKGADYVAKRLGVSKRTAERAARALGIRFLNRGQFKKT